MISAKKILMLNYKLPNKFSEMKQMQKIYNSKFEYSLICPFCFTNLESVKREDHGHWELITFGCYGCGWWSKVEPSEISEFKIFPALLIEYLQEGKIAPGKIAKAILAQKELVRNLSPRNFEEIIAVTLDRLFKGKVYHVGGSHDRGIDVIVLDDGRKTVVQIKRRISTKMVEGVNVIREFLGAMIDTKGSDGIFITTADHFSNEALKLSKRYERMGIVNKMELVDSAKLTELLRLAWVKSYLPWESK